ncbi:DUF5694 domain-containing protein [Geomicrobium sp. JSM 1781026]|uniref:DUF5694 domain-containing protein n=1 Tax=Geomicrobium sp. JSM 1781026 TaxID=3344580 RepID=UPI0035C1FEF2
MKKPTLLLAGTFHFDESPDLIHQGVHRFDDETEQSIDGIVRALSAFEPTDVAVELDQKKQAELEERYRLYLTGEHILNGTEIEQIGFRLQAKRIHAIDHLGENPAYGIGDALAWARDHLPHFYESFQTDQLEPMLKEEAASQELSVYNRFKRANNMELSQKLDQMYTQMLTVSNAEQHVGLYWVNWWYERNLTILANIARLAHTGEERIVVLIGGSHLYLLKDWIERTDCFSLEYTHQYI